MFPSNLVRGFVSVTGMIRITLRPAKLTFLKTGDCGLFVKEIETLG